jgi:hypothetical protein
MALSETARGWLIWAGVAVLLVALRVACVVHERSRPFPVKPVTQKVIDKDHLVVIPKFHIDDFAAARSLAGKTLWVKMGYLTEYFPFSKSRQLSGTDSLHFLPLEKFSVSNVVQMPVRGQGRDKEVWLVFQKDGSPYATVGGVFDSKSAQYRMQLDALFYPKDPRQLYEHWEPGMWKKIEQHELEEQMTLNQVVFSLGYGGLVTTEAGGSHLYQFGRKPGGEPGKTRVRFADGRVRNFEVIE